MPARSSEVADNPRGSHLRADNFWTSMPGVVTAIAALITALTGVFLATRTTSPSSPPVTAVTAETQSVQPKQPQPASTDGLPAMNQGDAADSAEWQAAANAVCTRYLPEVAGLNDSAGGTVADHAKLLTAMVGALRDIPNPPLSAANAVGSLSTAADRYEFGYGLLLAGQTADSDAMIQEGFDYFKQALLGLIDLGADRCT